MSGKAGKLVAGFRGRSSADPASLTDLLHRLSRLGEDLPEVAELDLNPVIGLADRCVAVDARVRVHRAGPVERLKIPVNQPRGLSGAEECGLAAPESETATMPRQAPVGRCLRQGEEKPCSSESFAAWTSRPRRSEAVRQARHLAHPDAELLLVGVVDEAAAVHAGWAATASLRTFARPRSPRSRPPVTRAEDGDPPRPWSSVELDRGRRVRGGGRPRRGRDARSLAPGRNRARQRRHLRAP